MIILIAVDKNDIGGIYFFKQSKEILVYMLEA